MENQLDKLEILDEEFLNEDLLDLSIEDLQEIQIKLDGIIAKVDSYRLKGV